MNWTEEEYRDFQKRRGKAVSTDQPKPSKSKYGNKKTVVDGITFDSKREAEYYMELKQLKAAGEIKDFGLQPKYELQPKFKKNGKVYRPINYYADFIIDHNDGTTEVVDIKGVETKTFSMKKKMFEYQYEDLQLKIIK